MRAALVGSHGSAGRGVEARYRRVDTKRDVHAIALGDQSPQEVGRAALERVLGGVPPLDPALPEDGSVEGVAGNEPPLGRKLDGGGESLVENVEQPALGRDEGRHAGHVIVVTGPARVTHPLQPRRGADQRVVGYRVAVGPVQVMRPFVYLPRPGLGGRAQFPALGDAGHAVGRQDPHDFGDRDVRLVLDDDQIRKVVHIRKRVARPPVHGDRAVQAARLDVLTRLSYIGAVPVQRMNDVGIAGPQRRRDLPVAAADVQDQPSFDAGGFENLLRPLLRCGGLNCGYAEKER